MGCAICKDPPFIFIHIPKTGGTSLFSRQSEVIKQIRPHCKGLQVMNGHRYIRSFFRGCSKLDLPKYFKFSIVRNPYDRFTSLWLIKDRNLTLDEFIEKISSGKFGWYALKTQSSWISSFNKIVLTDHLIKYEDYENGVNEVFKKLNFPKIKIPHLRKTRRKKDYNIYYTNEEQKHFVQKLYKLDFENFNYST